MRTPHLHALALGAMLATGIAGGLAGLTLAAAQPFAPRDLFLQRVEAYVSLHRRLEKPLPAQIVTSDPDALFAPRTSLGAALRKARVGARQGELFTPAVALFFRRTIAAALAHGGIDDFESMVEEENDVVVVPTVNGDYPAGASISFVPTCLLEALPPLPAELEYRFLGRALVLIDVHAGLIVDFVPQAFGGHGSTPPKP